MAALIFLMEQHEYMLSIQIYISKILQTLTLTPGFWERVKG